MDHTPVLKHKVLELLAPSRGKTYLDLTFGYGGHSKELIRHSSRVIGIDRDAVAYKKAQYLVGAQLSMYCDRFSNVERHLRHPVDGVLLDLGVSTVQLKTPGRGFSFMDSGPLDMRMGCNSLSAYDVINSFTEAQLSEIFWKYGEERRSRYFAKQIVKRRTTTPFDTTTSLADYIQRLTPRYSKIHPATRIFQAVRIYVNNELGELQSVLGSLNRILKPGGRAVVISFHSLEDRIVKHFFRDSNFYAHKPQPLYPSSEEVAENKKARSAKLRWAVRKVAYLSNA